MLNKCQFIGRLGQEPETRSMQNGGEVVNLSIGVSESWKDKSGEWQEKTEWVRVSSFNEYANRAAQKLSKGALVYVEGKMQTRKWQDQQGIDKFSTEIVLQKFDGVIKGLEKKQESNNDGYRGSSNNNPPPPADDLDADSIPF